MKSSLALLALALVLPACRESAPAPEARPTATAAVQARAKTAKIVFLDKEDACQCTTKRQDDSWAALQSVVGTLPVERLHSDTQQAEAAPYQKLRAPVTLPALYFLDEKGGLIEVLQGEVAAADVSAVLEGRPPAPGAK
jgi:hypothetical protein